MAYVLFREAFGSRPKPQSVKSRSLALGLHQTRRTLVHFIGRCYFRHPSNMRLGLDSVGSSLMLRQVIRLNEPLAAHIALESLAGVYAPNVRFDIVALCE